MNYRNARPGKPGTWNGRPMRWRTYLRSMKSHNRQAVAALTEKEIRMKAKLVRARALGIIARNVLIALGLLALCWWRLTR